MHGDNEQRGKTTSFGVNTHPFGGRFPVRCDHGFAGQDQASTRSRAERVQFIAERVRQGFYSTADAAAQTAAEIVKSPEPLDIDQA